MKKPALKEKIGVIGVGYIGLPLIAAFASVGHRVMGLDVDRQKMDKLRKTYRADIHEPGLNRTLGLYRKNIEFTTDHEKAMRECNVFLVTVGTPMHINSQPNFRHLNDVVWSIGKHLKPGQLIIFKSTVLPGMTRRLAASLEKISKLKAGTDFHVAFCPERTVEGRALEELCSLPKIVGGINQESLERGAKIIGGLGGKVVKASSLEIAELCKCIDNTYRVVNIAFANEIGHICESIGLDGHELASAVNHAYPRTNLFFPGLGAGGPCLSKDPQILRYFANRNKVDPSLISASIEKNKVSTMRIVPEVLEFLRKHKIKEAKIALVGLAFKGKPETDDIRNSPAVDFYHCLRGKLNNPTFYFYDPLINNFLGRNTAKSLKECLADSNVVMFLTNHQKIVGVEARDILRGSSRPLMIVDCWHNVKDIDKIQEENVKVFRIGGISGSKTI